MLERTTHAILGGEKLLWGEAGLGGVSPEISQKDGAEAVTPSLHVTPRQLRSHRRAVGSLRAPGIGE